MDGRRTWTRLSFLSLASVLLFILIFKTMGWAQATQGKIVGTVTDPSGAVVPGVKILVTNVSNGEARNTTTGSDGSYVVPGLIPGNYDVSAEKQDFSRVIVSGIVLQVAQLARVDITLRLGPVSQEVSVQGRPPVMQTEESSIGTVVSEKSVSDLPLNGRDFAQLAVLTPGAILRPSQSRNFSRTLTVEGTPPSKTEWLLGGISNTEQLFEGVALTPSIDAIQEFKVHSNAFSAEYGRGGAVVNLEIKSGTNQFHGTVFEFLRNDKLDARNFFAKDREVLKRNQFGGTAGFPIFKDKLFFFGSYEGSRERRGKTFNSVVPSQAMRNGDFSGSAPIFNPFSTRTDAGGKMVREPFQNNQILPSMFSAPAVFFLQKFIPLPNTPAGTFLQSPTDRDDRDLYSDRGDYRISQSKTIFVRWSGMWVRRFLNGAFPQNGGKILSQTAHNAAVDYNWVLAPNALLDLKLGYARFVNDFSNQGLGTNFTVMSGIGGFEDISKPFPGFPQFNFTGFQQFNGGQPSEPLFNPTNNFQFLPNLSLIKGRHSLKFGADLRRFNWLSTNSGRSRGEFTFTGAFTQDPQNPRRTGNAAADFLLGVPFSGQRTFVNDLFGWKIYNFHLYAQDDFRVAPKLTLNLGLRYEANLQPQPVRDASATFDPNLGKTVVSIRPKDCDCPFPGQIDQTVTRSVPVNLRLFPDLLIPRPPGYRLPNATLRDFDGNDFAPRVGFAWRPFSDNKTVFRGGYGIFYLQREGNAATNSNIPFRAQETRFNDVANLGLLSSFFGGAEFGTFITFPGDLTVLDDDRTPYLQEWNFAVQRELPGNLALEVGYVGNKGNKLEFSTPFNIPLPGPGPIQARRPFPRFPGGTVASNSGSSVFHALEIKAERRYSNGLAFLLSYNYGKSIDNNSIDNGASGNAVQDPGNLRAQRGRSAFDVTHHFVGSWIYELPVGKGKAFGGNVGGWRGWLISGWQVNGILTLESGLPFTPLLSTDHANIGLRTDRPDRLPVSASLGGGLPGEFDKAAFATPAPFTFGNSGRDILDQDGIANFDFALWKTSRLTERLNMQFRTEAFNLLNHANFGRPVTDIRSSKAGQVLSAGPSREIQFGLKLVW